MAWDKLADDKNASIKMFNDIIVRYDDFYSYYSLGIIYENHLYDPYLSINYYIEGLKRCTDNELRSKLINKLLLARDDINYKLDTLNQNINYLKALNFIIKDQNLDSAKIYLEYNLNQDTTFRYKEDNKSKVLNQIIITYETDFFNINNDSLMSVNPYDRDSILFNLANISLLIFKNNKLNKMFMNDMSKGNEDMLLNNQDYVKIYYDSIANKYINRYDNSDRFLYITEQKNNEKLLNLFKDDSIFITNNDIDTLKIDENIPNMPNMNKNLLPNLDIKMNSNE